MQVFSTVADLRAELKGWRAKQEKIGFVPTMGALHKGHLSLIERAKQQNQVVVCSIFVNPTQFNNEEDLAKYPRMAMEDIGMLGSVNCDIVFCPPVEEIYHAGEEKKEIIVDLAGLDTVMEGAHRPGHFKGVVQVVKRLFEIVEPDNAYFGEKDFQQLAVIKQLVKTLELPVKVTGCPILREPDGLAMSSRNMRLDEKERKSAGLIYRALLAAKENSQKLGAGELKAWITTVLNNDPLLQVEYVEIADPDTLLPVTDLEQSPGARVFIAVYAGKIRLIDNRPLN